jgi:hypothetical protein
MSERTEEYFQQFLGYEFEPQRYRIKGKNLASLSELLEETNPKYHGIPPDSSEEKIDYSQVVAHPAYAPLYIVPGLFSYGGLLGEDGKPLIKNPGKILHTGQTLDYTNCVPLTAADKKIYTDAKISRIKVVNGKLWIDISTITRNQDNSKIFCKSIMTIMVSKGGF